MGFDLKVSLENIIPLTYARDHFSTIVNEVQSDKMYILTKGGKPAIALIDVKYLEQLTGGQIQKSQIKQEINKNPEQVGLPKMVGHDSSTPSPTPSSPGSSFSSLKFKPTPPPPLGGSSLPRPKPIPSYPPKPATPIKPPQPTQSKPPIIPPKATTPAPPTPPSPPPAVKPEPKPVEPPPAAKAPGSLILPEDETKKSDPTDSDNAKIEVEFSTDAADLETSAAKSDNSTPQKATDEVEEMEIG